MLPSNHALRPLDVGVMLATYHNPGSTYGALAEHLGLSKSSAHAAIARLVRSGLASRIGREGVRVAPGPMKDFLQYGVPYAFPAETVPRARGIPTGFSAPSLQSEGPVNAPALVWPSRLGNSAGVGVHPLVPAAPDISFRDPRLYRLLAIVDALRLGDAHARAVDSALLGPAVAGPPV